MSRRPVSVTSDSTDRWELMSVLHLSPMLALSFITSVIIMRNPSQRV